MADDAPKPSAGLDMAVSVTDLLKLIGLARQNAERRATTTDDLARRILSPDEAVKKPASAAEPVVPKDPAREAAMNFVRQMRIAAR